MSRIPEHIRVFARERAGDRCEYCHKPNLLSTYGYHTDHIIPIGHGGNSEPDNLAWACFECNTAKGRDVASYDRRTGLLTPLFHPRRDFWSDHFELIQSTIVGKTAIGRVTEQLLLFNEYDRREARALLMEMGLWD
jgi:hypothetical protein